MKQNVKIIRDITTLRESIRQNWKDLEALHLSDEEIEGIRTHIDWCQSELAELRDKLVSGE
ncbi:MAG: hypothetical protein ABF271_02990 [Abyssibacter sp.]|uniref:hypothetical protein n=1 Tax=Abyssibacter sp. TaxID=2320200 RepID=UPI00321AB258